jgi:sphingosine kinase
MKDLEYSNYESVMTIGGDGLIHEVINGISSRPDSEVVLRSLPLAPIPGGSGNGLAKSVTFESGEDHSVTNSVFVAVKGKPAPLDLSFVQTATRTFLSFLLLGWGLISDVDILSESLRWMGEIRLYIAALYFVIARRIYRGRVSLYTGKGLQPQAGSHPSYVNRPESLPPFENEIAAGNGWEVIDSSFVLVWIVQTSHCTTQAYSGPGVTMDDGLFTVYVVDDSVSRFGMLQLLLNIDSGGHINHPDVKTFKCTAYRLEPFTTEGLFTLDGEQVEYGPIQGVLRPGAARVLACIDR